MRVHHPSSEGPRLRPQPLLMYLIMRLNCLLWMLKQLPNHVDISHVPVGNGHVLQGREKANCILACTPASSPHGKMALVTCSSVSDLISQIHLST